MVGKRDASRSSSIYRHDVLLHPASPVSEARRCAAGPVLGIQARRSRRCSDAYPQNLQLIGETSDARQNDLEKVEIWLGRPGCLVAGLVHIC